VNVSRDSIGNGKLGYCYGCCNGGGCFLVLFSITFFQTIGNPSFFVGRLQIDPLVWKEIFLDPIEKSSEQKRHYALLGRDGDGVFLAGQGFRNQLTSIFLFIFRKWFRSFWKFGRSLPCLWPMASRGKAVLAKMAPGTKTCQFCINFASNMYV
jgi:hypothetical protein